VVVKPLKPPCSRKARKPEFDPRAIAQRFVPGAGLAQFRATHSRFSYSAQGLGTPASETALTSAARSPTP
jgi:hypothetical protein